MRRLLGIILIVILALAVVTPVMAADVEGKLVPVEDNIVVRDKLIPTTNFYGEVSYTTMEFVFASNGNIAVYYQGYSYQFEMPFADLGKASMTTYQSKTQVVREYTVGRHTVTYTFDFDKYPDRVGLDFGGRLDTKSTLDIGILPVTGDFRVKGKTVWVGEFDPVAGDVVSGVGFDWGDATQDAVVDQTGGIHKRIRFEVGSGQDFVVDPSVVGTSTNSCPTGYPNQRHSFYASDRFWVFYSDGTNMVYKTSTDGSSWSATTTIGDAIKGRYFAIYFSGTYLHYTRCNPTTYGMLYYRRGTADVGGGITWSAAEQTVYTGTYATQVKNCFSICADDSEYPYITYGTLDGYGAGYASRVIKSSVNNGTWSTAGGFPYDFVSSTSGSGYGLNATVIPLTSGKIYGFYSTFSDGYLYGKLYNGSSWGGAEAIRSAYGDGAVAAIAYGDVVDVVSCYYTGLYPVKFRERSSGGSWSSETELSSGGSSPTISLWNADGDLIVFWSNYPVANHIYYKLRTSGAWDGSATNWIDETTDTGLGCVSSFYQYYGGTVGVAYKTKAGSPYNVKFAYLETVTAPSIITIAASNVAKYTARLNSTVVDDGGEACEVRFGYGTTSETADNFALYDTVTAWVGGYTIGQHPYLDVSGLLADTLYHYRVQIKNSDSTVTSTDEIDFTTTASIDTPVGFRGNPGATSISLVWDIADGASEYLVRFAYDAFPTTIASGTQAYLGVSNSYRHTGLTPGQNYYYSLWGKSGADYSAGYATLLVTTSAASAAGDTVPTNMGFTRWLAAPDYTNLSGLPLVYDAVNGVADSLSIPYATLWLILALGMSVLVTIGVFLKSNHSLMAGSIALMVCIGFGWGIQLVPLWIFAMTVIMVVAVSFSRREAQA